jgi:hypothetical protein
MPHDIISNPIEHPPGEWFKVVKTGYRMTCCDCSLVHEIDFRIQSGSEPFGGEFELRVRRDDELTEQVRAKRAEWRADAEKSRAEHATEIAKRLERERAEN